jgi:glycine cleavage system H lipoate-binding protein
MAGHDFLSGYFAHVTEYALAMVYLVLFVGFWRYVQGGKRAEESAPEARQVPLAAAATGWFTVPDGVALHPGHTWARVEDDGTVAVGLDDLGHRLVGALDAVELPAPGSLVEQGAPSVTLSAAGREVRLLSPVDGEVVAANRGADGASDPYGQGWLFRVRPAQWARNRAQLLSGTAARGWLEEQGRRLAARLSPEPVPMLQDGGAPVHGIAREIDPEHWDDVAREFFRTQDA